MLRVEGHLVVLACMRSKRQAEYLQLKGVKQEGAAVTSVSIIFII